MALSQQKEDFIREEVFSAQTMFSQWFFAQNYLPRQQIDITRYYMPFRDRILLYVSG